jgi:hypothetical protein
MTSRFVLECLHPWSPPTILGRTLGKSLEGLTNLTVNPIMNSYEAAALTKVRATRL